MKLICEECERQADVFAHGWRTYLTLEEDDSTQTATYCPECAGREFGADDEPSDAVP